MVGSGVQYLWLCLMLTLIDLFDVTTADRVAEVAKGRVAKRKAVCRKRNISVQNYPRLWKPIPPLLLKTMKIRTGIGTMSSTN